MNPPKGGKKSFKKKYYKKKNYKKSYKRSRRTIPTAPKVYTVVKLRYTENITLTMSSLVPQTNYVYRINDLYDPNYTGTGHQCYFRDQMFQLYQYGRVLWASIKLTLITDTSTFPMVVVLSPCQNYTSIIDTDITTACERKGSKECYLNNQFLKTLRCSCTSDYFFGQKKGNTLSDTAFLQNSSNSIQAANTMFFEILCRTLVSLTNNQSLYIKVDIEQIVRFEQPLQQVGS